MSPQFCPNQLLTKLALLLFYHRIFWINKRFVRWLWGIGILTVLWTISIYLVKWMLCWPVPFTWDKTLPGGTCIDIPIFLAASETINSVIDFVMIAMAIRIVTTLKMSISEKIRLSILFSVGSLYVDHERLEMTMIQATNMTKGPVLLVSLRLPRHIQRHVSVPLNPAQGPRASSAGDGHCKLMERCLLTLMRLQIQAFLTRYGTLPRWRLASYAAARQPTPLCSLPSVCPSHCRLYFRLCDHPKGDHMAARKEAMMERGFP